jgi:predicted metal-dependent hydrolase
VTGRAYEVRRSDRARRARLTVDPAGRVVVVLPRRATLHAAAELVARHEAWLERHVARAREAGARLASRPPLDGGRVLRVHGSPLRVEVVDGLAGRVRGSVVLAGDRLVVRSGRDGAAVATLLEGWLRARARAVLAERVAERAVRMGVAPGRVTVRDQRSRWGSASASGALSFSWRLVLAPPDVLDAVVVHELAHLVVRDHSPAFWAVVRRHAPHADAARAWLRRHGHELRAALD